MNSCHQIYSNPNNIKPTATNRAVRCSGLQYDGGSHGCGFSKLEFSPAEGYGKRHIHVGYKTMEAKMTVYLYIITIPYS